jgi:3-hydroxybutyryl-CoA dehydratase
MTVYVDDLAPGREFVSAARTVTEADLVLFAGVSGDFNPLHMDEPWVRDNTPFRGRIAHGMLVMSISSGLRTPILEELEVIAFLELSRVFVAPTYPGDTIHARWTVLDTRRSRSRPGLGIIRLSVEVHNQNGNVVQRGTDVYLATADIGGGRAS